MKLIGRTHEILIRRIDKDNPESDYYEIYPVSTADNIYMTQYEDESLSEFLYNMRFKYNLFVENLSFPVTSIQVSNGSSYGPPKLGRVYLSTSDFGLDQVDNTSDLEKPVSNPQRTFINVNVTEIISQINAITDHIPDWNNHINDQNNPHHVTWAQVSNNSDVNPEDLVDSTYVEQAIKTHNDSTDLTTLHPEIMQQISALTSQVNSLNAIITSLENSLVQIARDAADQAVLAHDNDESAHPDLLGRLSQLSNAIDAAVQQYQGLTGVEFSSNKMESYSQFSELVKTTTSDEDKEAYPSVNYLKNVLRDLDQAIYPYVFHLEKADGGTLNQYITQYGAGLLFVDEYDGTKGTYIFAFRNGNLQIQYQLPGPIAGIQFEHMEKAPTEIETAKKYPNDHALILCDKSVKDDRYQSIVMWSNHRYYEFVIETLRLAPTEKIYSAEYIYDNTNYDYAKAFPSGHGLLFVGNISKTGKAGVVLYNKGENPEKQEIAYGIRNNAQLMVHSDVEATPTTIKTLLPPYGNGIVYVKNMRTATSGIPGFQVWDMGTLKFSQPIGQYIPEVFTLKFRGGDTTGETTFTLAHKYYPNTEPSVVISLQSMNTNGVIEEYLNFGVVCENYDPEDWASGTMKISYYGTAGVDFTFQILVAGIVDPYL